MAFSEKYVSVAGGGAHDGTSEANAWTLAEAIAAYAAGDRLNVKAGTYANTTTGRTLATSGTTTAPVWWRGYASTIGDLDDVADGAASGPQITFTTARFLISAAFNRFSSLSFTSADVSGGGTVQTNGANLKFDRCRFENTAANANGYAMGHATAVASPTMTRCWFKSTTTADQVINNVVSGALHVHGCAIIGGINGLLLSGSSTSFITKNTFRGQGAGDCIRITSAGMWLIDSNSFYSPGSDAIELTTVPAVPSIISNNVFNNSGGYDIRNSSGANTDFVTRLHNTSYNATSGHETGFGDSPNHSQNTDGAASFTNAGSGDLSLVTGSTAKATGLPGKFENESYTSYLDRGAVQREEPTGGGGAIIRPVAMNGGFQ